MCQESQDGDIGTLLINNAICNYLREFTSYVRFKLGGGKVTQQKKIRLLANYDTTTSSWCILVVEGDRGEGGGEIMSSWLCVGGIHCAARACCL